MKNYDHSKLNPILEEIEEIINQELYDKLQIKIVECLNQLKAHVDWENSEKGTLYLIEKSHPQYEKDIQALMNDHKLFIEQLEQVLSLSSHDITEAIQTFKQFKNKRLEHIKMEDELDIKAHTKNFSDFLH